MFGSYVRQAMGRNSDLDLLVVLKGEVANPRIESVRMRRSLKGILMPMDILMVSENTLAELAETPYLIYREAVKTGEIVYESAAIHGQTATLPRRT